VVEKVLLQVVDRFPFSRANSLYENCSKLFKIVPEITPLSTKEGLVVRNRRYIPILHLVNGIEYEVLRDTRSAPLSGTVVPHTNLLIPSRKLVGCIHANSSIF